MNPNEQAPGVDAPRAYKNTSDKTTKAYHKDKIQKVKSSTKAEIIRDFEDTLSSAAIKLTDDGYEVVGKWCNYKTR